LKAVLGFDVQADADEYLRYLVVVQSLHSLEDCASLCMNQAGKIQCQFQSFSSKAKCNGEPSLAQKAVANVEDSFGPNYLVVKVQNHEEGALAEHSLFQERHDDQTDDSCNHLIDP
jgi:hypothetical protein